MTIFAEPPPTPSNLTIMEISSRSVKISWTVENVAPGVESIVVQWKEHHGNDFSYFGICEWHLKFLHKIKISHAEYCFEFFQKRTFLRMQIFQKQLV